MLEVVSKPIAYPITLSEAKDHLAIDGSDHDELVLSCIQDAVDLFERSTSVALITQTLKQTFDEFCDDGFELWRTPVSAVTAISYKDEDVATQSYDVSKVYVQKTRGFPLVQLKDEETFPDVSAENNNIEITFTAGYGDSFDVPDGVKRAIKYLVTQFYDCRNDAVRNLPTISDKILYKYKVYDLAL